jgi:hypothetical protein
MYQFDANPEAGLPDTAGYPVSIPDGCAATPLPSYAKKFSIPGFPVEDLTARRDPPEHGISFAAARDYFTKVLRNWNADREHKTPPTPHVELPEPPSVPAADAAVQVPYDSVVDADIPAGYPTPAPVTLATQLPVYAEWLNALADKMAKDASEPVDQTATAKPCCRNRDTCEQPQPADPTRAVVNDVLQLVADTIPVEDLAQAVKYQAMGQDGLRLFPAKVIARLAEHVLAHLNKPPKHTSANGSMGAATPN